MMSAPPPSRHRGGGALRLSSSSRFPSAHGHTPSYRSYLSRGALLGAFPYDVHLGPVANPPGFSAYWPGYSYDLGSASLASERLGYLDLANNNASLGGPSCPAAREYTAYSCR